MYKEVADAIRKGATMCHQIVGDRSDNQGGRCVLGAIPLGVGSNEAYNAERLFPILQDAPPKIPDGLGVPDMGVTKVTLSAVLADLNNGDGKYTGNYRHTFKPWSFEKIADWLDSLDAS